MSEQPARKSPSPSPSPPRDSGCDSQPVSDHDGEPKGESIRLLSNRHKIRKGKISGKAWGRVGQCCQNPCQFPPSIPFIIGNEFCERFNFYGLRAVMVLYLTQYLNFSDDSGTALFHAFVMLSYFTPLLGAIIADSFWGKFKYNHTIMPILFKCSILLSFFEVLIVLTRTILILSMVYAGGVAFVSLTAMPIDNPDARKWVPFIGFILVAIGTGGIKPCVAAFGGDQFDINNPKQMKLREKFFSIFYFSINAGSLISIFVTPILRGDVECFNNDCYPLAFGVPALLMVIATIIFVAGSPLYKHMPLKGNVMVQIFQCIIRAAKTKPTSQKKRFLERAISDEFSAQFVDDIYKALHVLVMFLPLPVFWALFDQQSSRWTLQATKMNGNIV
jgi:dipeptide/tripeptide permease